MLFQPDILTPPCLSVVLSHNAVDLPHDNTTCMMTTTLRLAFTQLSSASLPSNVHTS